MRSTLRAKRTLSGLAAGALALTLVPVAGASADIVEVCEGSSADQFTDTANANALNAIDCVASYDIALGYPDDTYRPNSTVLRGAMASFIARTMETAQAGVLPTGPSTFLDHRTTTHEDNIDKLFTAGVVKGTTQTTYEPNAGVRRGQMASFVVRALDELGLDLPEGVSQFADIAGTTHEDNIEIVSELGIALGTTTTTFDPNGYVTRGQMALFIQRAAGVLHDADLWNATLVEDPDPTPDPDPDSEPVPVPVPPPAAPQNVTAQATDNDIAVDWEAPNPPVRPIGGFKALLFEIAEGVDVTDPGFVCRDGTLAAQIDTAADVTTATFEDESAGDYCAVVRTISQTNTVSADSAPAFATIAGKGITNTELRFDHAIAGEFGAGDIIEMTFSERLAAPANDGSVRITLVDGDGDTIIVRLFVYLDDATTPGVGQSNDGFTDALLIDTDDANGVDGAPETVFIRVLEDAEVEIGAKVESDGVLTYPATITAIIGVNDRVDREPIDFESSTDLVLNDEGRVELEAHHITFPNLGVK